MGKGDDTGGLGRDLGQAAAGRRRSGGGLNLRDACGIVQGEGGGSAGGASKGPVVSGGAKAGNCKNDSDVGVGGAAGDGAVVDRSSGRSIVDGGEREGCGSIQRYLGKRGRSCERQQEAKQERGAGEAMGAGEIFSSPSARFHREEGHSSFQTVQADNGSAFPAFLGCNFAHDLPLLDRSICVDACVPPSSEVVFLLADDSVRLEAGPLAEQDDVADFEPVVGRLHVQDLAVLNYRQHAAALSLKAK